jgi:hypothetical protein
MGAQNHELSFVIVLVAVLGIPFVVGFLSFHRRHALLWCLLLSITIPAALSLMRGLPPAADTISLACALIVVMTTLTGYSVRLALQPPADSRH